MKLTPLYVDYQWKEQAKTRARLEKLKKPRVIPQEKPLANFSFKLAAFDLPPPLQPVSYASIDSPLGFERSLGRNPFNLRTNPSSFSSLLPSFSSSFPFLSNPLLVENPRGYVLRHHHHRNRRHRDHHRRCHCSCSQLC